MESSLSSKQKILVLWLTLNLCSEPHSNINLLRATYFFLCRQHASNLISPIFKTSCGNIQNSWREPGADRSFSAPLHPVLVSCNINISHFLIFQVGPFVSLTLFYPFRLEHARPPLQSLLRFWCGQELCVIAGPCTLQSLWKCHCSRM